MPYAINLTLDPRTSLEIERLYARLSVLGVAEHDLVMQYGPCVTLLVASDRVHQDDVSEAMERHVPAITSMSVTFLEPCVIAGLPPTLSLRVSAEPGLLAAHHAIFMSLPEHEVHLHHRPAHWQPHLKLANLRDDRAGAAGLVSALAAGWKPFAGVLDGLEVVQYSPVQAIWQAPLKDAP